LKIVGVVAIEDKLQDDVPDTIRALRDAGIKV
jgi:magnesium-transporting ATPase (P-type)